MVEIGLKLTQTGKILCEANFENSSANHRRVVENGASQDTFQRSQGKFFLLFVCTLFYTFLTAKNYKIKTLILDRSLFHYYPFSIYILNLKHIPNI